MNKERLATVFLIVLTNTIGATVILPMMPLYVEKQFGATPLQSTLVIAAFYVAQIFAAPWLGKLSDRFGRRPILIVSQIGTLIAYVMFFFATQIGSILNGAGLIFGISGGLLAIYLARILDGLTGGNVSVAEAYASDISDDRSRAKALGLIGGAVGVGHIIGPALAAILSRISLLAPIVGAAIMSAITLLLTIALLAETVSAENRSSKVTEQKLSIKHLLSNKIVLLIISAAFVIGTYIAAVMSSFSLYAERALFPDQAVEVVAQNSGVVIVIMGIGVAISQMVLVGFLVKRLGEQVVVVLGAGLLVFSAIGFASATAESIVLPIIAYAIGYSIAWPSLQAIMTRFGSKEDAGRLLGLFQSAFSLALIIAPIAAGLILDQIGPRAVFSIGTIWLILAALLAIVLMHIALPRIAGEPIAAEPAEARSNLLTMIRKMHQ